MKFLNFIFIKYKFIRFSWRFYLYKIFHYRHSRLILRYSYKKHLRYSYKKTFVRSMLSKCLNRKSQINSFICEDLFFNKYFFFFRCSIIMLRNSSHPSPLVRIETKRMIQSWSMLYATTLLRERNIYVMCVFMIGENLTSSGIRHGHWRFPL